jgi:putative transposase
MSYQPLLPIRLGDTFVILLIRKGFRFRVYPTEKQVARLAEWNGALRFLWNIGLEQRRVGLSRCGRDKRYPSAFDQINELTDLRAQLPWLADVPYNVCAQILIELDKATQRCFKRLGRFPRYKRRGRDSLSFTEPNPKAWRFDGHVVRFPKLGNLRAVVHRPLEGKPKACTLKRDGDQWFVSILCEVELPDAVPRTEPVVAIDRGVANLVADSDGNRVPNPSHLEHALARLRRAQRVVARRKKGSKNREKAKLRVMRLYRKVRRQREHLLHGLSHDYAKSHGTVVIEKLNVEGMVRNPCLARHILGAAWGKLAQFLRYKTAWAGGQTEEETAAYSSQTCAACEHVDPNSRHGERFVCTKCGHVDHADINAAKVLKARFLTRTRANRSGLPVEGSGSGRPQRSRKLKTKLRVPRRSPSEGSTL